MEGENCQASPDSSTQTITPLALAPNIQYEVEPAPPGTSPSASPICPGLIVPVETTEKTATQSSKRKKKCKSLKRDKMQKRKKLETGISSSDTCKYEDVQNQTVNSTQESNIVEKSERIGLEINKKKTGNASLSLQSINKETAAAQITCISSNNNNADIALKDDSCSANQNQMCSSQLINLDNFDLQAVKLDIKPLSEYVFDKKLLYKEVFTVINKKEFKSLLPEGLKKYDPRDVRRWCLAEIEIMSRKRLRSIITATPLTSSSDSDSGNEIKDVKTQIPDSSLATSDKSSVDEGQNQSELNIDENQKLNEGENLLSSKYDDNLNNEKETSPKLSDLADQGSDVESNNDKGENSDEKSDESESENEETYTNSNQPAQIEIEQLPPEQNDYKLFEDIFDTPDQEEIEDLMTIKEKKEIQSKEGESSKEGAKSKDITTAKPLEINKINAQAEIKELELRARVLQSFLRAQEKKQAAADKNSANKSTLSGC